jgi:hypothetical protein
MDQLSDWAVAIAAVQSALRSDMQDLLRQVRTFNIDLHGWLLIMHPTFLTWQRSITCYIG